MTQAQRPDFNSILQQGGIDAVRTSFDRGAETNEREPDASSNQNFKPNGNKRPRAGRNRDFRHFLTSAEFIAQMKPPDYLVEKLLRRGLIYTLTGNTGHCKTLIALLLAIKVARGDWFCGKKCRKGKVAFFAGENPENVRLQFYSLCWELQVDPKALDIIWHDGVFDVRRTEEQTRKALAGHPDLALCIYDSLQAFFTGEDDTQNMAMLQTALDFRRLSEGHPNRPSGIILAHPVKNANRDMLMPRGGSALTNELDGNLTCWLDVEKNVVTLHWHGKLRGVPFEPIKLETVVVKPERLVDAEGNQMPCTIVRPLGEMREAELAQQSNRREITILTAIKATPAIKQGDLATLAGVSRSTVQREITALKKKKWLRDYAGIYKLTKDGEIALELRAK